MQNSLSTINQSSNDFISDEIRFLIACCQTKPSEEDETFIISYLLSITNYQSLITAATLHGILPLVYKSIKHLSQDNHQKSIQNFFSELKPYYMTIVQKNMLMTSELIKMMHLLRENNIEAIAFKGPALSQMVYGDITLRQFGDLDILIKRSDISLVIDLLVENGYQPELELDLKLKETLINALNVIVFYKKKSNITIEIHWELLSKNYAIQWDTNALLDQEKINVTINDANIPTLPYEEQLLYLCAHGSKHQFERLEWICDIDRFIKANPNINWQYLLNIAVTRGFKRMFILSLILCHSFFGLKLPLLIQKHIQQDKILPKLTSQVIISSFSKNVKIDKNFNYFKLIWNMRENLSDKFRFTWHAFTGAKIDDFKFIKLPKYLAFLYPFVRQFRLLKKYIQRNSQTY